MPLSSSISFSILGSKKFPLISLLVAFFFFFEILLFFQCWRSKGSRLEPLLPEFPVLAAWHFAAHDHCALEVHPPTADAVEGTGGDGPMMSDNSQRCVDSLQMSLEGRDIQLSWPNATYDVVLCFCGIWLHQIGSLTCPAASA